MVSVKIAVHFFTMNKHFTLTLPTNAQQSSSRKMKLGYAHILYVSTQNTSDSESDSEYKTSCALSFRL